MRASMTLLASMIIAWEKSWSWSSAGKSSKRMVGGYLVKNISQTPYVVSIQVNRKEVWHPICSGTLLSPLYVITACQCVAESSSNDSVVPLTEKDLSLKSWVFVAGAVDISYPKWNRDPRAQIRVPKYIQNHPQCMLRQNKYLYSEVSVYDVALAKMANPFVLNEYVEVAEIFSFYETGFSIRLHHCYGREAENFISGWGSTDFKAAQDDIRLPGNLPDKPGTNEDPLTKNKLKMIKVRILQDEEHCRRRMYRVLKKKNVLIARTDTEWEEFSSMLNQSLRGQICSWTKNEGPCQGDAGAGFICIERSRSFIVGVNSWSIGCGDGIPNVAQSFAPKEILSWIEEEICSCNSCQDYLHLVDGCPPPVEDSFDHCKFPSTTTRTTKTATSKTAMTKSETTASSAEPKPVTDRAPDHGDDIGYSSAGAVDTSQLILIPSFFYYLIKLTCLRGKSLCQRRVSVSST